jgi:peptide/nickel transport system substrate-binding protein
MKRFRWPLLMATACLLAAACGGANNTATVGGKLVIDNESGSTWTCQFNPFNTAATLGLTAVGWVYEPLEFVNILKSGSTGKINATPWLATSSKWSHGYKTLTFTIRKGVTWTDGKPFGAADVVYTFNAMKRDKAIDLNAIWTNGGGPLTSVAQKGSDEVVFSFKSPAQPYFYFVADQTPIVPKHIWAALNQAKLISYKDPSPVGTGPYKVASCTPQDIKYVRNPKYWQSKPGHPIPAVKEVDYPSFLSNSSANLFLAQGNAQWGGQYIPNIHSFYIAKDPAHRHYWFPPVLNVSLVPNLTNPLLGNVAVRRAIAYAIDKPKVSRLGESGYQKPANQSGVITPTYQSWFDSSLPEPTYDPAKAQQILKSAGFKKGANGIYELHGAPLSFTIKTVSGFSDWDASLAVISQELKAVGINVTVQDENSTPYTTDLQTGHFQLAYAGSGGPASAVGGPTPYYELRGLLFSGNVGSTNYAHYKSASTDALFNKYSAASLAQQHQIINQIQKVMVTQVPFIPVTEGVDWYQYDTSHFTGWPTPSNPYAQPSPYQAPDLEVVLTHLRPLH